MRGIFVGLVILMTLSVGCSEPVHRQKSWEIMGDQASAELYVTRERDAERAFAELARLMAEADALLMQNRPETELGRLNESAAADYHAVENLDLYRCMLLGLDWARASRGAFDPTIGPLLDRYRDERGVPRSGAVRMTMERVGWRKVVVAEEAKSVRFKEREMRLELGGVAKGFALDMAKRAFARIGSQAALIRIGGNVYAWGNPPAEATWKVPFDDPTEPGRRMIEIRSANRGLALSSRYDPTVEREREGRLVLDPRTGLPAASDVVWAIAIADSGGDADAVSTALLVSGSSRGADLLSRASRVEAVMLVERDGTRQLLASASLVSSLVLSPELETEIEGGVRFLLPPTELGYSPNAIPLETTFN